MREREELAVCGIFRLVLRCVPYPAYMNVFDDSLSLVVDDCWSNWLKHGRDGGNAILRDHVAIQTKAFAEKVLSVVEHPPKTMLDIGSGDGLMAWAALALWPHLKVTITDISPALLMQAKAEATKRGVVSQCSFVLANAETLHSIADDSQDLIVSRSTIAYVADKPAAFNAVLRVLKPGGTMSIAEPFFREQAHSAILLKQASKDMSSPLLALLYRWKAAQFIEPLDASQPNVLTNYTEQDLLSFAYQAGFHALHLELHLDERQAPPRDWKTFCAMSPHPLAPSSGEILATRFSSKERAMLEAAIRPNIEKGEFSMVSRMIYLHGRKPAH
ncbi:MAG: methyltransferase domain-containing protein [Proteobacteria bacterium]|nr:methyltransferase domain-containing protein [Pseudomonadota bacterium]